MSESFSVGEIALYWRAGSRKDGMQVTVASRLYVQTFRDIPTGEVRTVPAYDIEGPGLRPGIDVAQPQFLRKLRPPPDWVKLCHLTDLPREVTCV